MTMFEERERAHENRFAYDEEVRFKITSRRRKLLGLWAAERIGFGDEESLKYALEIVNYGIDDKKPGAVINKIIQDAEKAGVELKETEVRIKNSEFDIIAAKQILEEKK